MECTCGNGWLVGELGFPQGWILRNFSKLLIYIQSVLASLRKHAPGCLAFFHLFFT